MYTGVTGTYKSVFYKKTIINGFEVKVIYNKLSNGTMKIYYGYILLFTVPGLFYKKSVFCLSWKYRTNVKNKFLIIFIR